MLTERAKASISVIARRVVVAVVARPPAVDLERRRRDPVLGPQPVLERGEIDEQLERRAGLALGLGRAVELALRVGAAAQHRAHLAVRASSPPAPPARPLAAGLRERASRPPPRRPSCSSLVEGRPRPRGAAAGALGVEPALGRHPVGEVAGIGARRRRWRALAGVALAAAACSALASPASTMAVQHHRGALPGEREIAGRRVVATAPGSRPRAAPPRRATARSRAWRNSACAAASTP